MKLSQRLVVASIWLLCACGGATEEGGGGDAGAEDEMTLDASPGGEDVDDADDAALWLDASDALDATSSADSAPEIDAETRLDAEPPFDAELPSDATPPLDAETLSDASTPADATPPDAGDAADAAPDAPPALDPQRSGFLAYGQLKLGFDKPIDAATLSISLSPARPAGIRAIHVSQTDARSVLVTLNTYHLPLDYTVTVASAAFSAELTVPGLGNGSRTAFVSSHAGKGDLRSWLPELASLPSGRAAGDALCQSEADAAGLKGSFRAFLSSDESADPYDAVCRMIDRTGTWAGKCGLAQPPVDQAPIISQAGLPIVHGASGVASGEWLSLVRQQANGDPALGHAWTGSSSQGRSAGANADCLGFVDAGGTPRGAATAEPARYLPDYYYSLACSDSNHLLCVQVGSNFFGASALHQRSGKAVFITSGAFTYPTAAPSADALTAADAFCRNAAQAAGHATYANFIAWMSDATHHAPCRLVASGGVIGANKCGLGSWPASGPWVRRDGFVVAENMTELLSGNLPAPLVYDASGAFLDKSVWTITNTWNDGTPAGACSGGIATGVAAWSLYYSPQASCPTPRPLVCFER